MVILVPWKPVVIVWLVLSSLILAGYVASTLIKRKPLFAPYRLHPEHGHHRSVHGPA
jgi:hypothetical protein